MKHWFHRNIYVLFASCNLTLVRQVAGSGWMRNAEEIKSVVALHGGGLYRAVDDYER